MTLQCSSSKEAASFNYYGTISLRQDKLLHLTTLYA